MTLSPSGFSETSGKRHVPTNNIILIGVVALIGAFHITYDQGAELLNFGAFIAFMGVNAASFVHYYLRGKQRTLTDFLVPVLGFVVCAAIWWNLSPPAKKYGAIWLAIGVAYGAWKTNFFRKEMSFEVPPEE